MITHRPRIKIISDGHASGTKVYVENEDGTTTHIPNVVRAYWHVYAGSLAKVTLDLINVELDVLGEEETDDD